MKQSGELLRDGEVHVCMALKELERDEGTVKCRVKWAKAKKKQQLYFR